MSALFQSRLQKRLDERERIARELHDTLLQGTQALALSVEAAFQQAQQAQAKGIEAVLQTALKRADAVIIEGRDRIQDLRLTSDLEADLESAFANLGSELSETSSAKFEVLTEGTPRLLLPAIRYEIYRIGREGLLNAFQHAHATEILVQLTYAHDEFRVRIQDNGTGLDEAALTAGSRPGHWGLPGMRERAKKIGGVLEIHSQPQVGTKIDFSIAGRLAFLVPQRKSFWWARW